MLWESVSAAVWTAVGTGFAMCVLLAVRALIRAHLLKLTAGARDVHRFFWQVFAVGPRLTLLAAGILLRAMGEAKSQTHTLLLFLVLGGVTLGYVTAELLEGAFYHPDEGKLFKTEGILGVLTPLLIGSVANAVGLVSIALTHLLSS
jgi:hypothetical protein